MYCNWNCLGCSKYNELKKIIKDNRFKPIKSFLEDLINNLINSIILLQDDEPNSKELKYRKVLCEKYHNYLVNISDTNLEKFIKEALKKNIGTNENREFFNNWILIK